MQLSSGPLGGHSQATESINNLVTAASALIGVIIGSLFSYFIARLQFRATTLSANRQAWINTLRDSISQTQQMASTAFMEAFLARSSGMKHGDAEAFTESTRTMNFLVSKIQLLLNPKESDHGNLIALIFKLQESTVVAEENAVELHNQLQREVTALAQTILKREWVRVKRGK